MLSKGKKLLLEPAKVNKVKIFSGPCYIIKCVLTLVSGVQESVLVDFISHKKVKVCITSKFVSLKKSTFVFIKNVVTKTNKFIFF